MSRPALHIIKIGGHVIDDEQSLQKFMLQLSRLNDPFILVHGGGKLATSVSGAFGIDTQMVDGRRITDAQTLDVVVMVYAGLVNKKLVALLQASGKNAVGLCGADANIIPANKRPVQNIDYGFVGDVTAADISVENLQVFLSNRMNLVIAPLTHDGNGQLLNTNADTVAASLAEAMAYTYNVNLVYCFEKSGVLEDAQDAGSVIPELNKVTYQTLKTKGSIHSGMIPKLDNAFHALEQGVSGVHIIHALQLQQLFTDGAGTKLVIA